MDMEMNEDAKGLLRVWEKKKLKYDWDKLPILADALQESGYENDRVLKQMRAGGVHINQDIVDVWMGRMLPELGGYDWAEAFGYAGEPDRHGEGTPSPAIPGHKVSVKPFCRKDVVRIVASVEGDNDGPNWLIVGELRDGRFFALDAGCDYTGWD